MVPKKKSNSESAAMSGSQSMADQAMMEKIDKLFACGLGHSMNLPQLVVVGDQSSGKSSVLAGITKLPFPRDSSLCTRFATKITFRHSDSKGDSLLVSIQPAQDAKPEHKAKLAAWTKTSNDPLDPGAFKQIMKEAEQIMGIETFKPFSKDVLTLELSGPQHGHFSVVDVPGIFRNPGEELTMQDMELVRSMVQEYMRQSRSIMLTVVGANVDIATQEITNLAKGYDPDGTRTLGVLTKPDLVEKGAENGIMDILQGKRSKLKLGWHVVKNPSKTEDDSPAARHHNEKDFFEHRTPWNALSTKKWGAAALQERMRALLMDHTKKEFVPVRRELNEKLNSRRKDLESLGQERETKEQQIQHLMQLVEKYHGLTSNALTSSYHARDVLDQNAHLKLANLVVNRNEYFSQMMQVNGHEHEFEYNETDVLDREKTEASIQKGISRLHLFDTNVDHILQDQTEIVRPQEGQILILLQGLLTGSKGFEFGTVAPSIIPNAFLKQSAKWETIAMAYISDIIAIVHRFINDILEFICPDRRLLEALQSSMYEPLMQKYKDAIAQVSHILQLERNETILTLSHHYNHIRKAIRKRRQEDADREEAERTKPQDQGGPPPDQIPPKKEMSNDELTVRDIHDTVKSYYTVARARFVDNICMQASGHYLVTGPSDVTPLNLFSSAFVTNLKKEELEAIAGEDEGKKEEREDLRKVIRELEEGQRILL